MQIIGKIVLEEFKNKYADVRSQVDSWVAEAEGAEWGNPMDVKERYPKASILSGNQVVFDLKGSKYRLLTKINYPNGVVLIKNAGPHEEYMSWDTD